MNYPATIVEINGAKARFLVDLGDGTYAAFTLLSRAVLTVGLQLEPPSIKNDRGSLMPMSRQAFEARCDLGPASLEACRAVVWG